MITEILNSIISDTKIFYTKFGFIVKKHNEGIVKGIQLKFSENFFNLISFISFRSEYNSINYIGCSGIKLEISEVEDIYQIVMRNNGIIQDGRSTLSLYDYEFPRDNFFELTDTIGIQAHTQKILDRFETYMLPMAEQYLSLPYWAQHYEMKIANLYENNEPDSFYRLVNDNYSLKHLIILKLCGSPSFEEAYEIRTRPTFEYLDSNPDQSDKMYEGACRFKNVLLDLKATLDATPAKYDYLDTTPPYRFIKKSDTKPVEAKSNRAVMIDDRAVNVEINAFEISVEQQAKIDSFLKDIKKYFEGIREVIIDNAEFENEQGQLKNFEDCSYLIQDIAEAKGLLDGEKLGFEKEAAEYLYLKEIAIDADQNQVTCTVASDFSDIKLTALLDFSGHVEIVHS